MTYDLTSDLDRQRLKEKLLYLKNKGARVEVKEKRRQRSLSQNNYLHLILTWYGMETGYTLEEVKQDIFKRLICADTFIREKQGRKVCRSSADLDTLEMTNCIEKFRNHASVDLGIYLPSPDETHFLQSMQEQIEKFGINQYL